MLIGRFEEASGRPYIEARVTFINQNISGDLFFLVDTGADSCLLMPADGLRIGLDYEQLSGDSPSIGIGGTVHSFVEPALISFADAATLYVYQIEIDVIPKGGASAEMPSLLGRAILDRWRMVYNPLNAELRTRVHQAEFNFPVQNPPGFLGSDPR